MKISLTSIILPAILANAYCQEIPIADGEKDGHPSVLTSSVTMDEHDKRFRNSRLITGGFSTDGESGINIFDFSTENGNTRHVASFNAGPNPAYLCFSKEFNLIYAINEVSEFMNEKAGGITAISHNGRFENLAIESRIPVPTGGPCHISISPGDDYLLVANYGGGSAAVVRLGDKGIPVEVTDTIIYTGIDGKRSHAHMADFSPDGKKIYITDLGLDRIMIYRLDRTMGKLIALSENGISLPPGTGPRHFVFNSQGTRLYLMGELNSTVTVFETDEKEGLKRVQTINSLRGGGEMKNHSADIHIGKSGEYLYASNRGENTITTFKILADGRLAVAGYTDCGGNWPRNFALDPSGRYLLVGNQRSDEISVFAINQITGLPEKIIHKTAVKSPSCLKFFPF